MSRKIKESVALVIVILALIYVYGEYRADQNQSFPINNQIFWLGFDKNISQVKDVDMNMNYAEKSFKFKSNFIPSARDIVFGVDSINFNQNNLCDMKLSELDLAGNLKQSWVPKSRGLTNLTLKNDPKNTTLLLEGTCFLNYTIPNGYVQTEISNHTKPFVVGTTTFQVSFDDYKFGCRENCLYNDQFHVVDEDSNFGIKTVIMKASDIDAHNLQFSIRTFDKQKANSENISLVIFMGLLFLAFQIEYDIYKEVSISGLFLKIFKRFRGHSVKTYDKN